MLSVLEVKRKLPRDFIKELYEIYSPLVCDKILSGLNGERNVSIRVNTIKTNVQEIMKVLKENNIKFERVMWYKDGLILKNSNEKQINALKISLAASTSVADEDEHIVILIVIFRIDSIRFIKNSIFNTEPFTVPIFIVLILFMACRWTIKVRENPFPDTLPIPEW